MAASGSYAASHGKEIRKHLEQLRKGHGVDVYMVLFTDVIGNASDLFVAGDHTLLAGLDYVDQPVHLEGVMSRKKDFVPVFGQKLKNI
jgi:manganese-dependent inorganic pyrophosphatase